MKRKDILYLLFLYFFVELLAYVGLSYLQSNSEVHIVYNLKQDLNYKAYQKRQDPDLGWPSPKAIGVKNYDTNGSRPQPTKRQTPSISVYGDSFVYCAETEDKDTWPYLLSQNLMTGVDNFGVNGYGTDQAYLRYLKNKDRTKLIILGFTSDNIMRNVNQYRNLLSGHAQHIGLKPRYILDQNNSLIKIPKPVLNVERFDNFRSKPEEYLQHEYFLPGDNGPTYKKWSWLVSLTKCFSQYAVRAKLSGNPFYKEFFETSHPSKAVPVTSAIMKEFVRTTASNKQVGVIVLFPQIQDFAHYEVTKRWIYDTLEDELKKNNIDYINLGSELIKVGILNEYKNYFAPNGHYNEKGNSLVAQIMEKKLKPFITATMPIKETSNGK